jgi:signal transduction histidine kinase
MLTRRSWLVYGALLAIWASLIGWQVVEHVRVSRSARSELRHRAEDISSTLALIMRQQRLFVSRSRLEAILNELVKQGELRSIVLLNAANEERAVAGSPIDARVKDGLLKQKDDSHGGEFWDDQTQTVALMNLVDLGTNVVLDTNDLAPRAVTNSPTVGEGSNTVPVAPLTNVAAATNLEAGTPATAALTNTPAGTNAAATNSADGGRRGGRRGGRLTDEERREEFQKRGVHNFIILMSTQSLLSFSRHDAWTRIFIAILATISVAGYGLAWGNLTKTSELQIRLVRASELNSHLKEMNLAAAGLAHETRNPLNIVRGMAQMISRREDASPEVRARSRDIIDETDRITAQLNEFINYSRPREVRRAATRLNAVVGEVVRALNYDLEEKKIQLQTLVDPLTIEADEQLLRQALFNLVLNAIQAVPAGGEIRIRSGRANGSQAYVEVADNGPGVAPEHRSELFKPYFTTHSEGTGLGLAVVQQIVLAHGWEIACLPNQPSGAIFRITQIKTSVKS